MIVDSHFHAWRLARGDYGWLTPALGGLYRDFGIEDWQRQAAPLGVRRGVLVQAAPTEAETRYLLELAAPHEGVAGVVGWADLLAPDASERVAELARQPKLKGLRPMLQDIADPDWVLQAALAPALRAMAGAGLVFDALIHPHQLPRIRELARRHPSLRIVIDHAGKPGIAQGQWEPWGQELRRIAEETEAVCKLSGLMTQAGSGAGEVLGPWMRHVLECFGAGRVIWGSDWPVLGASGSYEGWWLVSRGVCAGLTDGERDAIFGGNACRVYRLDPEG